MSILDGEATAKLAHEAELVREAVNDGVSTAATRTATRLRSDAKTRKSAATREKIMQAATDLMIERGNTDFQMSEVSARCKMSKGSLYYYFSDKSSLVHAVFDRSVDELVEKIEKTVAEAPSAQDSIVGLVEALDEAVSPKSPLALAIMHRGVAADGITVVGARLVRIVSILTAQFERAKSEGLVRPEVESHMGAAAIAGAFLVYECAMPERAGVEDAEAARKMLDLVFSGIGTERSKRYFSADGAAADNSATNNNAMVAGQPSAPDATPTGKDA